MSKEKCISKENDRNFGKYKMIGQSITFTLGTAKHSCLFFFSFWGQISISVCEIVSADEAEFSNSPCAAEHPIPNTNPHAPYRSVVDSMLGLEVKLRCSDVVTSLLSFTSSGRMCWSSMPLGLLLQGLFCKLVWYEVLHFPSRCLADEAAGAAWPFSRARLDLLLMALI